MQCIPECVSPRRVLRRMSEVPAVTEKLKLEDRSSLFMITMEDAHSAKIKLLYILY